MSANWKAEIRNYVLPLIPLALVGWISTLSDRYVIGAILGLEKVGIYAAIYALISRPFALAGNIFITTLRPIFFEAVAIGDRERAKAVLRYWVSSLGAIFLGGIFLLFLLKDWIAGLLLAVPYRAGTHLMLWIGIGAAILSLAQVFNTVSLAHKRSRYVLCSESAGAAAALFIGVPMVWCFGLSGAALAVPLSFSIQLGTAFWLARRSNLGPLALPCGRPQPQYIPWKEAA